MIARRKRRRKGAASYTKVGLGWYNREDWDRLREISEDRDQLEETFEEWEASALSALQDIQSTGQQIERVLVDPEQLLSWCNEKGVAVNASSRAEYVGRLLKRKSG